MLPLNTHNNNNATRSNFQFTLASPHWEDMCSRQYMLPLTAISLQTP